MHTLILSASYSSQTIQLQSSIPYYCVYPANEWSSIMHTCLVEAWYMCSGRGKKNTVLGSACWLLLLGNLALTAQTISEHCQEFGTSSPQNRQNPVGLVFGILLLSWTPIPLQQVVPLIRTCWLSNCQHPFAQTEAAKYRLQAPRLWYAAKYR